MGRQRPALVCSRAVGMCSRLPWRAQQGSHRQFVSFVPPGFRVASAVEVQMTRSKARSKEWSDLGSRRSCENGLLGLGRCEGRATWDSTEFRTVSTSRLTSHAADSPRCGITEHCDIDPTPATSGESLFLFRAVSLMLDAILLGREAELRHNEPNLDGSDGSDGSDGQRMS